MKGQKLVLVAYLTMLEIEHRCTINNNYVPKANLSI